MPDRKSMQERASIARAKVEALGVMAPDDVALLPETCALKPLQTIAERALGIGLTAVCGEGLPASDAMIIATNWGVQHVFTDEEAMFLATVRPSDADRTRFVWRYEGLVVLLWALGYHDALPPDHEICDTGAQASVLIQHQSQLAENSTPRHTDEIRDAADYYAHLHAALMRINPEDPALPQAHVWVVRERWEVLQWLWTEQDG